MTSPGPPTKMIEKKHPLPKTIMAHYIYFCTMWGPRSIAKLVHITPITMVYGTYNYS